MTTPINPFPATLFGEIRLASGVHLVPPLMAIAPTRIVMEPGAILRWPTLGSGVRALTSLDGELEIVGGVLEGPTFGAYVADEVGIYMAGTSGTRRKGLRLIGTEIRGFGAYGVRAQFTDRIRINGEVNIHYCGYAGLMALSCDDGVIADGVRLSDIGPGSASNSYGLSLSQLSGEPVCNRWRIGAAIVERVPWCAVDAHGSTDAQVVGLTARDVKHGVHLAGGADNLVERCNLDSGSYANTGTGINFSPISGTHSRARALRNTLRGFGAPNTISGPVIGAEGCAAPVIEGNDIENWAGCVANVSGSADAQVRFNRIGAHAGMSDSQRTVFKQTGTTALKQYFIGNMLAGTADRFLDSASTARPTLAGRNDWRNATTPLVLPLPGFVLGSDAEPMKVVDLGSGGGSTTIDVSEIAAGGTVQVTAATAITVTDLTGADTAAVFRFRVASGSAQITFSRAASALGGSVDFVGRGGTKYDTLVVQQYAPTGGIRLIEHSRSMNG